MSAGDLGVSMIQPRIRSLVCPCLYRPLDSFRCPDHSVTMETALPIVQAYRQYSARKGNPCFLCQKQMASMISCSDQPYFAKRSAIARSYSLEVYRPEGNGHGLVSLVLSQVEASLESCRLLSHA